MSNPGTGLADGYWLIEPDELSRLMAEPRLQPLAETVLAWLAEELTKRLDLATRGVRLEVIWAEYLGAYPCLAAKAVAGELPATLETEILDEVPRLLEQTPVAALVRDAGAVPARRAS